MEGDCYIDEKKPRSKANRKVNKDVLIGEVSKAKVILMINQGHVIDKSRNHDITLVSDI